NLAIQDAVAAANRLGGPLRNRGGTAGHFADVRGRRLFPTRATPPAPVFHPDNVPNRLLASRPTPAPPWAGPLLDRWPVLRRIPPRRVGVGFRPELGRALSRSRS